jgi:hypothetical protein
MGKIFNRRPALEAVKKALRVLRPESFGFFNYNKIV